MLVILRILILIYINFTYNFYFSLAENYQVELIKSIYLNRNLYGLV